MKIIHVLSTDRFSGAENVTITIIKNIKKGNEITYVSPDGPIKEYLSEDGIDFEPIKKVSISEIKRIIKKHKPDIIHAHDFKASVICAFACGKSKLISHIHKNAHWIKKICPYSLVYLMVSKKFKKILLVSNSIINEYVFKKSIINKTKVIGNPIDIQSIINKSNEYEEKEEYDVIFMGRFAFSKNPMRFIKIIQELSKKITIKAIMIGEGDYKKECQKYILQNKLENTIELRAFLKNPYPVLKKSKILCMTSQWEGFGLVALEALSLNKPVVATRVGGIPNIIDNNCGYLADSNEEMIGEIIKLLKDKNYYDQKSIYAIKRAQELDNIEGYVENIKTIYTECTNC